VVGGRAFPCKKESERPGMMDSSGGAQHGRSSERQRWRWLAGRPVGTAVACRRGSRWLAGGGRTGKRDQIKRASI
jgi:hypothetical protein